jgi:geranylgeranyl reductase family protein
MMRRDPGRPATTRDAIVVGAGPAGLYAAHALVEEGLDVLVLEEHGEIGAPTHCTGIVSTEIHDLYKVPDDLVLHRPRACLVVPPSGGAACFRAPDEDIVVLDRGGLDRALAGTASQAGAAIQTGQRVDAIRIGSRHAEVVTADGGCHRARAVVLACGVTYRFHRLLGAGPPPLALHTAQVEVDAQPAEALELHLGSGVAPEGFAWVAPVARGDRRRLKAGVLLRGDARAHLARFVARMAQAGRVTGPVPEPVRRLMPMAPVRRTYADRLLAVGDAAGLTKPVTGGGIFYSLLSAALAAETLAGALAADDLGARRLAVYETRWRQRLMPEIRTASWFRHLFAHLSDAELDVFVRATMADDVQAVIQRTARFNWHRAVILALLRQRGIASILLRALFR